MDLGACPKSHTERLKTEFLAAKAATPNDPTFARFQKEYESNIFQFVDECDRRIRAAHRRLEKTPEENAKTTNLVSSSQGRHGLGSEDRGWFTLSAWTTHPNQTQNHCLAAASPFGPQPHSLPFTFRKLWGKPNADPDII